MKHRDRPRSEALAERRQRIATEAARLIARDGLRDYAQARRRAAQALGFDDAACRPSEGEIRERLLEYQGLFGGPAQPIALQRRREAAALAMEQLAAFDPRLLGRVLDGSADERCPVQLQVFSDDPEAVARWWLDAGIPARALPWQILRLDAGREQRVAAWSFLAGDIAFEVAVLPPILLRQPPLDGDGRPLARATLPALRKLLAP